MGFHGDGRAAAVARCSHGVSGMCASFRDRLRDVLGDRIVEIASDAVSTVRASGAGIVRRIADGPVEVSPYLGYGTTSRVLIMGRVTERAVLPKSNPGDRRWRNAYAMYRRISTDGIAKARVQVRIAGVGGATERVMTTDDEGFFRDWITLDAPLDPLVLRHSATFRVLEPAYRESAEASGEVMVPPADAEFGVISDLDDTVIQSHVDDFMKALMALALENAHTRTPFPRVAEFYRALALGPDRTGHNPLFYVSSSPWEILDAIEEFLALQKIPPGPVLLRDWDVDFGALKSSRLKGHKLPLVKEILELYPKLNFVLIGDTTQQDPEIYKEVVAAFPDRILAVYIRAVSPSEERKASVQALAQEVVEARSRLILVQDTEEAERDAAANGLIANS